MIDYDAESEAPGDKSLWSSREFGDFVLRTDWRIKSTPYVNPSVPIIRFDGTHKKDASGKEIRIAVPDSDSGIYLRGSSKAQINIWGWPIGSGEVYGYRTDASMPAAVRAGVTPKRNVDRDIGEWNSFEITMRGNRLTVALNGAGGAQSGGAARTGAARTDRVAAPWREEERDLGRAAEPGAVPEHLNQGALELDRAEFPEQGRRALLRTLDRRVNAGQIGAVGVDPRPGRGRC